MVFPEEFYVAIGIVLGTIIIVWIFRKLLERRKRKNINDASAARSGHYWSPIDDINQGLFCTCCKQHLTTGYECDYCTLLVDNLSCLRNISIKIPCKVNYQLSEDGPLRHHWIPGNIDADKFCRICDELCGGGVGILDFKCSWCREVVHTHCMAKSNVICNLGTIAQSVIQPMFVETRKSAVRNQRFPIIDKLVAPDDVEDWRPIFVIVNPKSGSGTGKKVLRTFRSFLHPAQVVDVTKCNMKLSLQWIENHPEIDVRVIIAGGDGTISLVLDDIEKLSKRPAVAVLPLGTGNDLSRVLGWGKENNGDIDVTQLTTDIQRAEIQQLDRWTVSVENNRKLGVRFFNKVLSMTNYVSIGVDACVTLGMQNTRESIPKAISSRLLNKLLFFTYGTRDVFERACKGLQNNIELTLDDRRIDLPDIEGLVFLNIGSWGAGVKPWEQAEKDSPQCLDDGLFEVFAVTSSFHIAQLQVGLSSPILIGQARKATLRVLRGPIPMQSDGEAWMQNSATITLTHKGVCQMLRKIEEKHSRGMFF